MFKWYVDAGHGGSDSGAVSNGLKEKDLTLKIALKIQDIVSKEYEGVSVKLSRTSDKTLSLSARTNEANAWGADLLTSVHINAGGGTGFESYIYNGSYSSKTKTNRVRGHVHDAIVKHTGFSDRGKKEANFHMVRQSKMTAHLTENGFIDNAADAKNLKSDAFLEKIARGHVEGAAKAYGWKRKTKPAPSKPATGDVFYRVVTGSFKDKKNAEARVKALKNKGFDSFIDVYKK